MLVDGEAVNLLVDVKVNAAAIARERNGEGRQTYCGRPLPRIAAVRGLIRSW